MKKIKKERSWNGEDLNYKQVKQVRKFDFALMYACKKKSAFKYDTYANVFQAEQELGDFVDALEKLRVKLDDIAGEKLHKELK